MSILCHFHTAVSGKWILCGEHAVLRGSPALVFPVYTNQLQLKFTAQDDLLEAVFLGPHGEDMASLFWLVLKKALSNCGRHEQDISGKFELTNSIPLGTGMGASAALCIAVARWCRAQQWIEEEQVFEFARQLENLFHGESSGVDIAVLLAGHGLKFTRDGLRQPIYPRWQPFWYLSYSGKRGMTADCIQQVKSLGLSDPELAEQLDIKMKKSVALAEEALLCTQAERGLEVLVDAIELALAAFSGWGLTQGIVADHLEALRQLGALAVKPTGSGDGGFVLSLWRAPPPKNVDIEFISLIDPIVGRAEN